MLADQIIDRADIVLVFLDRRDAELVARGVVGLLRDGPPENAARHLVIPDFRQAEGQDEQVGLGEDVEGLFADLLVVSIAFGLVTMPQRLLEFFALEGPFELLTDDEAVHHAFAALHDIGVRPFVARQDVVIPRCQPVRDIGRKTRSECSDLGARFDDPLRWLPPLGDPAQGGVCLGHLFEVGVEVGMFAPKPGSEHALSPGVLEVECIGFDLHVHGSDVLRLA